MKKITLFTLAILFLFACKNNEDTNDTTIDLSHIKASDLTEITPIFTDISFPEAIYKVIPEKDTVIKHSSGTEIDISPGTFVFNNGDDVKDEVKLIYKEFRTASDIIFNDIDMKYDSADINYDFQTAGMFNIAAYSKGEEVFIKEGKHIEVSFASNVPGDYNFYRYENGNWVYQEPIKAVITVEETSDNTEFTDLKPVKLNTKTDIVIDIKSKFNHIDELKDYKKIIWKYAGDLSKEKISKLLAGNVADPIIETSGKAGIYMYKFKKGKEDYSIEITPVFTGRAYKDAVTVFNANVNQIQIPRNNIRRNVRITQLGLMNYDVISKQADALFVKAEFYLSKENGTELINSTVFHISGDDNMIIKQKSGSNLGYSESFNNKLVAILPGKRIAVLNNADFDETMENVTGKSVSFFLEPLESVITKPEDLDQIIAGL